MFDPSWDDGCPSCTGRRGRDVAGLLDHLHTRDTTLVYVSRAPLTKIEDYKASKRWTFPWYSSFGSDFNYDFHVTLDESVAPVEYNFRDEAELRGPAEDWMMKGSSEQPGMSCFLRVGDDVFHTYSMYARGAEQLGGSYYFLDLTALGRQEEWEEPEGPRRRRAQGAARLRALSGLPAAPPDTNMCSCPGEATILHADLDAFYASVEQRDDPRLRGRPVIVGGGWCSPPATRRRRTASGPRWAAARRASCARALVVVPPRMEAYTEASKAVFEVFDDTTPFVEGISIDEAFLDVGGLRRLSGTPVEIAARLRREVRERVGLPITVGVARTKFLAKVASGVGKPDGLLVVPPDGELAFLHPLPGRAALGRRTGDVRRSSTRRGIVTVGEVAAAPRVGARRDARPLRPAGTCTRSRTTAIRDRWSGRSAAPLDRRAARPRLVAQGAVGDRHRRSSVSSTASRGGCEQPTASGAPSCLRLRFDDFSRATRSHTMPRATAHTPTILAAARALLAAAMPMIERAGLTCVGISVSNLDDDGAVQLVLPFDRGSGGALDAALDDLRERFGSTAVGRTVMLGRDPGLAIPMLPD